MNNFIVFFKLYISFLLFEPFILASTSYNKETVGVQKDGKY